ncbi:unnamed protein product [marine sediment metagenome]|uniref:Type II secretion system protein GspG C-terminal domain-containing protein n=1 Tax=marine sediment metagenome TaxID=412755 RepID=X0YNL3_9ZZZZ
MRKARGFTLIELLVVIAIIAILAIAIVVAYTRAKEAAANSKRIEACRQIATAQEMYYQNVDNNNSYCRYLSGLLVGNKYLATDPSDSGIGPNALSERAVWSSRTYVYGSSTGFKAQARLSRIDH